MTRILRLASGIALAVLVFGLAYAADQTILGRQELVSDPTAGVNPSKRKLIGRGVERASLDTIVGNPTVTGATITFFADGATSSNQVFVLPAGHWSALGTGGFMYKDPTGVAGPVQLAKIEKSKGSTFQIKAMVSGKHGSVTVVPPNPGTGGCILFQITGGDRYHMLLGPGSVIKKNSARTFLIEDATTEGLCVLPCFTDTGDGTIHDSCTGLQWEKKTTTAGLSNVDNVYTWAGCCNGVDCNTTANLCQPNAAAAATCAAEAGGGAQGCSTCTSGTCDTFGYTTVWDWLNQLNASNFAGHSDWRLPSEGGCNSCWSGSSGRAFSYACSSCSPHELETILLSPFPCGTAPCIDPIFGPTASADYWSASTHSIDPSGAWNVYFPNGTVLYAGKGAPSAVRAVRSGP